MKTADLICVIFFFQAEDGIRVKLVTGVQTCALPISALLLAMTQVVVEGGCVDRRFLERMTSGWPEIERRLAAFTPARVAAFAGVPAATIERLALEFAEARSAVCYSRVGVCVGAHATAATFATDLLNIVTGRLGREGGPMFRTPAFDIGRVARMGGLDGADRWRS